MPALLTYDEKMTGSGRLLAKWRFEFHSACGRMMEVCSAEQDVK